MKKIICSLVITAALFSQVSSLSWSGLFNNNSKLNKSGSAKPVFEQSNSLFFSIAQPVSEEKNIRLNAEVMYNFDLTSSNGKNTIKNVADLDLLKLSGQIQIGTADLNYSIGRFNMSDISTVVFNQCCDGVYAAYKTRKWKTGIYAGYTGLLNSLNVSMIDQGTASNDIYRLAVKYVPVMADFSYSGLFGSNVIDVQADGFISLQKNVKNKFYGSVTLTGPILKSGSYSFAAVVGTENFQNVALFTKLDASFYISDFAMATAGAEYASGKTGPFESFKTISSRVAYNALGGMQTSGIIAPKVSFLYAGKKMYVNATEKIVFSAASDIIKMQGFDTSVSVIYNIFTDLQIGCDLTMFNSVKEKELSYYGGTIKATLAF